MNKEQTMNAAMCSAHGPFDPRCETCPHCLQDRSLTRLTDPVRASASAASTPQEECDGCVRGLMTYRRGPDYDTQRWHKDGAREFLCELPLAKWGTGGKDHVCRELHANTIRGVESAFTAKEWQAASDEMHSTGNSSWVGVVQIAVERLRAALASQPSEAQK